MAEAVQRLRCVPIDGMTNLRNLGGYRTKDGSKTTKWGVLYRSDQPAKVPAAAAQATLVDRLHIHHSVDLRDTTESSVRAYDIPHICRHAVPIDMSRMGDLLAPGEDANKGDVAFRLMCNYYRHLATAEAATVGAAVKTVLSTSPSSTHATLLHCTAGKDRTGWTVYVLLSLLDVAEEEKRADYALTQRCFTIPKEAYEYEGAAELTKEAFDAFWGVSFDYLDGGIDEVNKLGGVEAYAKSHMGLTESDIQLLRDVMLERCTDS